MKDLTILFSLLVLYQIVLFAQSRVGSFEFEEHTRTYEVYLPQNFHANMPVVFVLHGYKGTILGIKNAMTMHEVADTMGFITVYPQSASVSWNTGETEPPYGWGMYDTTVNDVDFISALINIMYSQYEIDLDRVYACGFSSGGEMSFRLITDLGYRFAAAASVSGPLNEVIGIVKPIQPFPILHIHGTNDQFISYEDPHYNLWSVEETLNFWIENNECTSQADTISLPDIDQTDGSTVEKISYTNCSGDTKVVHYKVIGGGHSWPGSSDANRDINASAEILNFFMNYDNPSVKFACVKSAEIYPNYVDLNGDTLFINSQLINPENHSASVYAKIFSDGVLLPDSILLYDDGLHYDNDPNDNVYGNAKWLSGLEKGVYKVDFYALDLITNNIYKYHLSTYFTTSGPVVYDNYEIPQQGENYFTLKYELRNNDLTDTVTNVSAYISTSDTTNVTDISGTLYFGNISPGEIASTISFFPHYIYKQNNPSSIDFIVYIISNGHFFWSDSFTVYLPPVGITEDKSNLPIEYELKQNYPNPFNPVTKIKYQIPELSFVTLKVYDVLGNEIETLVNEEKPIGSYEVEFNAHSGQVRNLPAGRQGLSSGVYFYQLSAVPSSGSGQAFVETKKMVLLR
jgi:polyhydroxybutyrate depolymerase